MAAVKAPGKPDQNVELAAKAGDPGAMRVLGQYLQTAPEPYTDRVEAERWLLAAAEAGDPEAMFELAWVFRERADDDAWMRWCRRAAEAGWVGAMGAMALTTAGTDEEEPWLRRAAGGGARPEMLRLANMLAGKGQATEAEQWYHAAITHGLSSARHDLASFLIAQDRPAEAEEHVRAEAEAGSQTAATRLAEALERMGRADEAAEWRTRAETSGTWGGGVPAGPGWVEVIVTAVVTTALVPFVQALVSKTADDAYGHARQFIQRLVRRNRTTSNDEEASTSPAAVEADAGLAIVQDPQANISLVLWSNASDEALRALSALDMNELTLRRPDQGQVHLVWHPASSTWHIRGH
ncbi:tetratricopeptide repeat protein [Streptomyces griseorubiginosus]|uniref:tetratricopeptide repeat protein n=1 Tax=Streptomyces griseorubiginosus TaxID=67304 RepID=UPI00114042AD|nr:sel1 repeat family protein [Streptomyces griseorubiginosus]